MHFLNHSFCITILMKKVRNKKVILKVIWIDIQVAFLLIEKT